jgi:hypothetical protein
VKALIYGVSEGNESLRSRLEKNEDRFLYLYLSLMIAVFSILLMVNIQHVSETNSLRYEGGQESTTQRFQPASLHGDHEPQLLSKSFPIFESDSTKIAQSGFEALLFLLHAHNVNALIQIPAESAQPERAFARALTVQSHLDSRGITPFDVRVEVVFNKEIAGGDDALLTLYSFE